MRTLSIHTTLAGLGGAGMHTRASWPTIFSIFMQFLENFDRIIDCPPREILNPPLYSHFIVHVKTLSIIIIAPQRCRRVCFQSCPSVHSGGGSHVTITHDVLDLTLQGPLGHAPSQTWDLPVQRPPPPPSPSSP